jgi:hypothetical protein
LKCSKEENGAVVAAAVPLVISEQTITVWNGAPAPLPPNRKRQCEPLWVRE